ncbi:hypothetical protein B0H11DRAFT_992197 [Mycena galericulata]|nr:hypothetical protein B0H11DRAFT_992197 [Mycena galericulata]
MAPVLFALVSVVCVLQTLAAPLQSRAVSSIDCGEFNIAADTAISSALNSFASISANSDPNVLAAEGSLTAANNANRQIGDSLLTLDAPPPPSDALSSVVSGLTASAASLAKVEVASLDDSTKAALTSATGSINTALGAAQKALAANCGPTVFVAPSTTPGGNFYSMVSISEPPAQTTALRTEPSFASVASPQASTTSVAPENAVVATGGNANGAMSLVPSMSLASAISLVAIICFF